MRLRRRFRHHRRSHPRLHRLHGDLTRDVQTEVSGVPFHETLQQPLELRRLTRFRVPRSLQ